MPEKENSVYECCGTFQPIKMQEIRFLLPQKSVRHLLSIFNEWPNKLLGIKEFSFLASQIEFHWKYSIIHTRNGRNRLQKGPFHGCAMDVKPHKLFLVGTQHFAPGRLTGKSQSVKEALLNSVQSRPQRNDKNDSELKMSIAAGKTCRQKRCTFHYLKR